MGERGLPETGHVVDDRYAEVIGNEYDEDKTLLGVGVYVRSANADHDLPGSRTCRRRTCRRRECRSAGLR